MLSTLSALTSIALELFAELIAPSRCVACDELVHPRVMFCAACGVSVMHADERTPGRVAVFDYGGAIATAIVRFKYAGRSDLAARFAAVMSSSVDMHAECIDIVAPVPLHARRLAERGFDQAALLAAPIARRLRVRHAPRALVRVRETPPQASLDRAARIANVEGAFVCPAPAKIDGARILLVDDVRTTGATLTACERALRRAGAASVTTLVLASRDRARNVKKAGKYED